jgi:DNA-binding transcriptional ArsR family regulator
MKDREVYKRQARLLKALANESRLMIVDRLGQGECTVGELVKLIGSDQSTVSKHLAVLRSHGSWPRVFLSRCCRYGHVAMRLKARAGAGTMLELGR